MAVHLSLQHSHAKTWAWDQSKSKQELHLVN